MQTKFKKHDKVRLLIDPDPEYVEYYPEFVDSKPQIKKGMIGEINVILPNGEYHVRIFDEEGKEIAYVPMAEDFLEPLE
ncbi:MAG: hypothetical protein ACFFDT_39635 [Candidatus Hodarchaeota archaeon]